MNRAMTATTETEVAAPRLIVLGLLPFDDNITGMLQPVDAPTTTAPRGLPPELRRSLVGGLTGQLPPGIPVGLETARLTPRERQVCDRIREGLSNKQIASALGIAIHTVKCHVHNILMKLGLESRLQIALFSGHRDSPAWEDELASA